jgi:hypothetical protein
VLDKKTVTSDTSKSPFPQPCFPRHSRVVGRAASRGAIKTAMQTVQTMSCTQVQSQVSTAMMFVFYCSHCSRISYCSHCSLGYSRSHCGLCSSHDVSLSPLLAEVTPSQQLRPYRGGKVTLTESDFTSPGPYMHIAQVHGPCRSDTTHSGQPFPDEAAGPSKS